MRFPSDFLDDLRRRLNLSDIIGLHVRLQKKGREYSGLCPFHKEKTPSFSVNDEKGVYYCFGCRAQGDVIGFVMQFQNLSFLEAVTMLAQKAGLTLPRQERDSEEAKAEFQKQQMLYETLEEACLWFQEQLIKTPSSEAFEYLKSRGLSLETIKRFRIGYAPKNNALCQEFLSQGYSKEQLIEAGLLLEAEDRGEIFARFRHRIMFPICNNKGQVIAFGGRILSQGQPKYLNSPESSLFSKGKILYKSPDFTSLHKRASSLIVVEGYMDVIALSQAGFSNAVAPLGTALTQDHLKEIWKTSPEPILCFDGDEAGRRAAYSAAEKVLSLLKPGYSLQFALLPQGEDPDSLIRGGNIDILKKVLGRPHPLIEILWTHEVLQKRKDTPEQIASVRKNFKATLKKIEDSSIRYIYQKAFDERFYQFLSPNSSQMQRKNKQDTAPKTNLGVFTIFNTLKRQHHILFAILINHSILFHEVSEQFAILDLADPELQKLRDDIFLIFNNNPNLDERDLKPHLLKQGYDEILNKILSEDVYIHASFAKPEASLEAAAKGWNDICRLLKENYHMKCEFEDLQKELKKTESVQDWLKYKYLMNQSLLSKRYSFDDEPERTEN